MTKDERRSAIIGFWCAMAALFTIGMVVGELVADAPWIGLAGPLGWVIGYHQSSVLRDVERYLEDRK